MQCVDLFKKDFCLLQVHVGRQVRFLNDAAKNTPLAELIVKDNHLFLGKIVKAGYLSALNYAYVSRTFFSRAAQRLDRSDLWFDVLG